MFDRDHHPAELAGGENDNSSAAKYADHDFEEQNRAERDHDDKTGADMEPGDSAETDTGDKTQGDYS
jgi:hypothetical protein